MFLSSFLSQLRIFWGFFQIQVIEFFSNKMRAFLFITGAVIQVSAFGFMALFVMKYGVFPKKYLQGAPDYLSFLLIAQLVDVVLWTAEGNISNIILSRNFANLFTAPCSLPLIILASNSWKYLFIIINAVLIILIGVFGFGMAFHLNIGVLIVFITGFILLMAIDMGASGFKIVTKSTIDPINWFIGITSRLLSGSLFPVEFLPAWLRWMSKIHPQYYINKLARQTIGGNQPLTLLWPDLKGFLLTASFFLVLGYFIFRWGFRKARVDGTIGHV